MAIWNPWKGCRKKSEGCANCYIHRANARKGINTDLIYKTEEFYKPVEKNAHGAYKIGGGRTVYVCFSSDFLLEEATEWRYEAWKMMQERSDLQFLFLSKRPENYLSGMPSDIAAAGGLDNVIYCCTIENQRRCDERLPVFLEQPAKHKLITMQPMLEGIDILQYLSIPFTKDGINRRVECVVLGGESGNVKSGGIRVLDYRWVLDIRRQCEAAGTSFEFRQLGSIFIKDGKTYTVKRQLLCAQARKAGINFYPSSSVLH